MSKKNSYFPFESKWSLKDWEQACPNLTYRMLSAQDFPAFLPPSLANKFNCAVLMASGNETNQTYVLQGFRIDGMNIDEHQYIATFDLTGNKSYEGFVDHAGYTDRSIPIPPDMLNSISLSGINVDYQFSRKPPNPTGTISELVSAGLIDGFQNSVSVQKRKEGI